MNPLYKVNDEVEYTCIAKLRGKIVDVSCNPKMRIVSYVISRDNENYMVVEEDIQYKVQENYIKNVAKCTMEPSSTCHLMPIEKETVFPTFKYSVLFFTDDSNYAIKIKKVIPDNMWMVFETFDSIEKTHKGPDVVLMKCALQANEENIYNKISNIYKCPIILITEFKLLEFPIRSMDHTWTPECNKTLIEMIKEISLHSETNLSLAFNSVPEVKEIGFNTVHNKYVVYVSKLDTEIMAHLLSIEHKLRDVYKEISFEYVCVGN